LKSAKRFVYGVQAMAEENGKAKIEDDAAGVASAEFEPTMKRLERHSREMGPWTDEDERWFQFMTREFGGAPERDSDL
jgi:hypothetical protein